MSVLLDSVAKWRAYIGLPKDDVSVELALIVEYLQKNWGRITIKEFDLAWLMAINGKFEDCDFFGNFSPMYVGKVLNSYLFYRKMTLSELLNRKGIKEYEENKKKPTPEESAETMRDILSSMYKNFVETKEILDPFNILYNFFRKHKWLRVTQSDIDEAMRNANMRYYQGKQKTVFSGEFFSRSKEDSIKCIARNYIVEKYLEKNNIDVLINNINSELFTNLEHGNNG